MYFVVSPIYKCLCVCVLIIICLCIIVYINTHNEVQKKARAKLFKPKQRKIFWCDVKREKHCAQNKPKFIIHWAATRAAMKIFCVLILWGAYAGGNIIISSSLYCDYNKRRDAKLYVHMYWFNLSINNYYVYECVCVCEFCLLARIYWLFLFVHEIFIVY